MSPNTLLTLVSVLLPAKLWFTPAEPINIVVQPPTASLVLTDFACKPVGDAKAIDAAKDTTIDARTFFPALANPGTYILWAVPQGKTIADFVGTPLVIEVRTDKHPGAPQVPMVVRVQPLCYAVLTTDQGDMTMAFYYDVAPTTVESFLRLSAEGYYDGLTFHRILPDFVLQGGDPAGDGSGGPGYQLEAEFNSRKHESGVLSMARTDDPNSAGSQFFICLNYEQTQHLDGKYTAFGRVTSGMDAARKIAAVPLAGDPREGKPAQPQYIRHLRVFPVTAGQNPYAKLEAP